ncbi:MAG: biotin/lipoyl-binding protein, partial [Deltaproteobacteria bacterium]
GETLPPHRSPEVAVQCVDRRSRGLSHYTPHALAVYLVDSASAATDHLEQIEDDSLFPSCVPMQPGCPNPEQRGLAATAMAPGCRPMNYVAVLPEGECVVEIVEAAAGRFCIAVDGRLIEVDACVAADGRSQSLLIGGRSFVARVAPSGPCVEVEVEGSEARIEMLDLRRAQLRRARTQAAEHAGSKLVCAPMPGRIVAVLVKQGAAVEAGQGLVVIEAMKMENELRAPRAGRVTRLEAVMGTAVESGAVLCEVG